MGEQRWLQRAVSTWASQGVKRHGAERSERPERERRASHAGGAGCPADLQGAGSLRGQGAYLVQMLVLNSFGNLFLFTVCFKEKKCSQFGVEAS